MFAFRQGAGRQATGDTPGTVLESSCSPAHATSSGRGAAPEHVAGTPCDVEHITHEGHVSGHVLCDRHVVIVRAREGVRHVL